VTYFFNGGREKPFEGEDWNITPSPEVSSYDQAPDMSAEAIANHVITAIDKDSHDFVVANFANFANGDMLGHTGKKDAIIASIEALDLHVGRAVDAAIDAGYSVVVTADHGNCEEMSDLSNGNVLVQHTSNPVPCLVMDPMVMHLASDMGLSSIAPTILELMGLPIPASMTGKSLLSEEREAERLVA
jgi:2,3-bisphosphoglycerate-independent phosphoglycerate mutase